MTQRRLSEQSASEPLTAKRRPSNASEGLPQEIGDNLMRAIFTPDICAQKASSATPPSRNSAEPAIGLVVDGTAWWRNSCTNPLSMVALGLTLVAAAASLARWLHAVSEAMQYGITIAGIPATRSCEG